LFRVSYDRLSVALSVFLWAAVASAQNPPAAPSPDDEDLEVPAAAKPATPATSTVPAPAADRPLAASPQPTPLAPETPAVVAEKPRAAPDAVTTLGFRIAGYVQAQLQHNQSSEDQLQQSGAPLNQNEFLVRRARLRFDREWEFASATLELDANTVRGPTVGLRRAEAALFYRGQNATDVPPLVMLSVGVLDIPFGFELDEATRVRWFMERSVGSGALFPTEMDAGAKISGAASFLRYAVAVTNGEPVDARGFPRDPNSNKDVIGRFNAVGKPVKQLQLGGGTSFAIGKGFHAGQPATKSTLAWNDVNQDGLAQPSELVGLPGSAATPSENFKRWAIGLDFAVGLQTSLGLSRLVAEAFVASNYDRGYAVSDPVQTTLDARQAGGYVAFTQELTRYGLVGFRAAVYDPNSDLVETRAAKTLPKTQTVKTFSPLAGLVLPNRARLLFQYDFVRDYLARDAVGVPTDAKNDQWTLRLQVEL